ncbi:MAG: endopeptidase La [Anaerolineaceae bacterium]|nr:endopeptidase La [Anaerolineaceae bacterium]
MADSIINDNEDKEGYQDFVSSLSQRTEELFRIPDAEVGEDGTFLASIIVLRNSVVFPRMISPVFIEQQENFDSIQYALENGRTAVVMMPKDPEQMTSFKMRDFYHVGLEIAVGRLISLPENNFSTLIQGRRRVVLQKIIRRTPVLIGKFSVNDEEVDESKRLTATLRTTKNLFERCAALDKKLPEEALPFVSSINDPSWISDMIATTINFSGEKRRNILLTLDPLKRLDLLNHYLAEELQVLELESKISSKVQNEVDRSQREYYLREQAKAIQDELGEGDVYSREINELRAKIEKAGFGEEVRKVALKELERISMMAPMSPEIGIARTYIDWLLDLPWNNATEDNLDINNAEMILNRDHYGLKKTKDRIIEYIAVRSLKPKKERQPILCFVGPPGTGKTSIGKSIAEALGREFVRISLGGVTDEAEIRGHRRTYIGALPGRIIQTMKRAGTINPVFMLDEIDKLGSDYRGDPSSALLEVLDPEQNNKFADHYLEVDYDLSKVMFITTANTTSTIPEALLDRMEVIEFNGYVEEEKLQIVKNYLLGRQIDENGLTEDQIKITDEGIIKLCREYTYESGVRNLERELGKVCRKVARRIASKEGTFYEITDKNLSDFMGPAYYFQTDRETNDEVGVVNGLAWTSNGGDTLKIEAAAFEGKGSLQITGQIGDVMQESAQAAMSFVRSHAKQFNIKPDWFEKNDIHIHVPEGAVPKDGPSAGVTLAAAIISAITGTKAKKNVAMTGEITLRGNVLPVGGIREKLLAAHRLGIKKVLIPEKNMRDLEELPEQAKNDLEIIPLKTMDDVIFHIFDGIEPKMKTAVKKKTVKEKAA